MKLKNLRWLLPLSSVVFLTGSLCGAQGPASREALAPAQPSRSTTSATPSAAVIEGAALPSLSGLVESVKGSVVNVEVQSRAKAANDPQAEMFERFFGGGGGGGNSPFGQQPREQYRQGAGSGVVIDPRGHILTNNHVVEGAVSIRVTFDDGRSYDGEVMGTDPLTDIALVKLKGKVEKLPVARLGDSDAVKVGDWLVAIGNPFGLASSVSAGILSARSRDIGATRYDEFLQTDAAINPGNSGGPLFNLRGEIIGINTAIIGGGTGIGFAVPTNLVKALLPQLESKGSVTRAFLGITIQDLSAELATALKAPVNRGAIVTGFNADDAPAKKAGLAVDDVIVAVDGRNIESGGALTRTIALKAPKSTSTLTYYRNGQKKEAKVTLAERPDLEGIATRDTKNSQDDRQQKIGLDFRDVDPRMAQAMNLAQDGGAMIINVAPISPAQRAGLEPGMVVSEVGGKPVKNARELLAALKAAKSGDSVLLRVMGRGGAKGIRALKIP